jgi:3',5'-cyclic AMP phosphodiesterase CpdA
MNRPQKVLQIIHISDLHVSEDFSDKAMLAKERRWFRLKLRHIIEKRNLFGWHEGTLDHDPTAETDFVDFLRTLTENDPEWFPDSGSDSAPQTWLVDTGDLTTFGDESSLQAGRRRLESWRELLHNCKARLLFGNHDAWPGTQPALRAFDNFVDHITRQWERLSQWSEFHPESWLDPLSITIPGIDARIELYGLNSVCFGWYNNFRAIGRLEPVDLEALAAQIRARQERLQTRAYRILALHHPIAFPWPLSHTCMPFFKLLLLEDSTRVIENLKNESNESWSAELSPYIHLLLSGHTHLGLPGIRLPRTVKEAYQGRLGTKQLQLVAGPLMLVGDREEVRQALGPQTKLRDRRDFAQPYVFDATQQFQILRFYRSEELANGLYLERRVLARLPNADGYQSLPELHSRCAVLF